MSALPTTLFLQSFHSLSYIKINNSRLLAFNTSARDVSEIMSKIKGWIYHPRLDYWRNEEQLQFILDCAVTEGGI